MIRGCIKSIIDKGPLPLKVAVSLHMCHLCVRDRRRSGFGSVLAAARWLFGQKGGGTESLAAIK